MSFWWGLAMAPEFKSTPFGPIPQHWGLSPIGSVGTVQVGRARSPGTDKGPNMVPYLRVANVLDGYIDYSDVNEMNFSPTEQKKYTLQKGDILLNEGQSTELVGRSAIYDGPEDGYCYQNSLVNFRCGSTVEPRFARAVFKRWLDIGHFTTIVKQTTSMAHLGGERFARLAFPVPPLAEQRQLAVILDTIDDAICKTEQIIAKLKQVKQGLLRDLLTRGSDHNGELRDPERHSGKGKHSPMGRIPRTWQASTLGSLLVGSPQTGVYKPGTEYGVSGSPIVRIDACYDGVLNDVSTFKRVKLTDGERLLYRLEEGNILINRVNSIDYVGKAAHVPQLDEPVVFESNMMRLRVDRTRLDPGYAIRVLCASPARQFFFSRAKSAIAQASVNQTDVRDVPIALPDLGEQQRIVAVLGNFESRLGAEEIVLGKIRLLKRGLMEDLLTVRVRVTRGLEQAAE